MYPNNSNDNNLNANLISQPMTQQIPAETIPIYNAQSINDNQVNYQQTVISNNQQFNSVQVQPPQYIPPTNPVNPMFVPNLSPNNNTHVVRCLPPNKREYIDGEYALVSCSNITTMWINGSGFSYLTKYSNDNNYFFLPLTERGFNLVGWNESATRNKINRQRMEQFVTEVNSQGRVEENIRKGHSDVIKSSCIYSVCGVFCLALFALILWLWIYILANSSYRTRNYVLSKIVVYGWAFCLVFGIAFLIMCCRTFTKTYKGFAVSKAIIANNLTIEGILSRWNNEYFLPNGLYVIAPRNLAYLHFVLDSNLTFMMENHPFPNDLVKKR